MLPGLFRYGLKTIDKNEDFNYGEDESDYDQQEQHSSEQ